MYRDLKQHKTNFVLEINYKQENRYGQFNAGYNDHR